MKNRYAVGRENLQGGLEDLTYEEFDEMLKNGIRDTELFREFGVDKEYLKRIEDEYQKNY